MRLLRIVGSTALTVAAAVGVACALVWGATLAGWIQPFVVVSGSMEPAIATGDLVVATRTPVERLEVGQVATIRSGVTGRNVTHRITAIETTGPPGEVELRMKGDANDTEDAESYVVRDFVWQPGWQISGGGFVVAALAKPGVAAPLLVAIVALVGLNLVPSGRARPDPRPRSVEEKEGERV